MRARGLLFTSYGEPRLVVPGILGVIAAFIVALALITFTNRPRTDEERADTLVHSGKPAQAERIYARLLREHPTVPLVLSLLEAHDEARLLKKMFELREDSRTGGMGLADSDAPMSEPAIDELIDGLPADVAVVASFSRGLQARLVPPDVRSKIAEAAAREPPAPWANHLLGREAQRAGRHDEAAAFFEKEGIAFPERSENVDTSLQIWIAVEAWDTLRERLADPRVFAAAGPHIKYKLAIHDQDWRAAARWLPAMWAPHLGGTGIVMSAITALAWAFFCARLGKLGLRVRFRLPMYTVAFLLGIASVLPTVLLIAIEEAKLRLVETGDPARDILFFVFGVGLREEASKLLLFLPLLPVLRKWGDKLDVLVCGALVGLGFAAEENLNYLAQENLHTGLGRFLTANFFHMAMTGTLASALDDFVADREKHAAAFMRTSLFIVGMHGVYDFLLSHEEYGGTYFAMTVFVFLTKIFLDAADGARRRADRGITPLHAFIFAVAVVTGVSLAYATMAVGPKAAFLVVGSGLLGQAIIVYVFVRTLRTM
ncbi:MAG TPA: PrsW family glutamic-type intramembrane protease [Labilithrix sp.]|nr:PrsW family glutamic-type intramembrane protease [Labilithrix sp.]